MDQPPGQPVRIVPTNSESVGSIPKDSEAAGEEEGKQGGGDPKRIEALEKEVFDLKITNRAKDWKRLDSSLARPGDSGHAQVVICLIAGTNRPQSSTRQVTLQVAELYRELSAEARVLDLLDLPQEVYAPAAYEQKPPSFLPFADAVLAAAGLVVVAPEYNGGAPGALKYFIDLLKFPESFNRRPVCFIGLSAGRWGGLRPVEQLQQIFGYRNAYVYPERVFLPQVHSLLGESGRITDPEIVGRLKAQAAGFIEFIRRLQNDATGSPH